MCLEVIALEAGNVFDQHLAIVRREFHEAGMEAVAAGWEGIEAENFDG